MPAVEIRTCDVEAVDVAGDHASNEEECVDEAIGSWAGDEEDGEWWDWGRGGELVQVGRERGKGILGKEGLGTKKRTKDVDCED